MAPGPWNETTEKELLLLVICLAAPVLPKWDVVAEKMGEGFTSESVRQRFQKLRRNAENSLGGVPLGVSKNKGNAKAKVNGGGKRKRAVLEPEECENSDGKEADETKKIKTEVVGDGDDYV